MNAFDLGAPKSKVYPYTDYPSDKKTALPSSGPGTAPLGEAIMRVWPAIETRLDEPMGDISHRQARAWTLRESVDFCRTHRRDFINQSMIVDRNICTANRALQLLDPSNALPEANELDYLYQAVELNCGCGPT